jgi:hypothetical protein
MWSAGMTNPLGVPVGWHPFKGETRYEKLPDEMKRRICEVYNKMQEHRKSHENILSPASTQPAGDAPSLSHLERDTKAGLHLRQPGGYHCGAEESLRLVSMRRR